LTVIPQVGVEPDVFKPSEIAGPATDGFRVGYAGRFVAEKGIDVLLNALRDLGGEWQADLAGSGPDQARLAGLARRLEIADRVRFLPWMSSAQTVDYYRSLDVLVLPSRSRSNWKEQFGRVLVDAMACGVPVIGSTCGEIPNVVGDAGLIFPEGNATALRDQLSAVQHDRSLRCDLAQRGRQRVLERFTQEQIARQTHEVYCAVLRDS
jgi:glycosyltransferase involved in cell wall biosynthesis